jgi:transcriptional regulator with XRE-family HTH domain
MNVEEAVGMELSACRHKKRISQERLGFDAGVHRTYVSLIERGIKSPTVGVLFRLCRALDAPPVPLPSPSMWLLRCESGDSMATKYRGRRPVWEVANTENR